MKTPSLDRQIADLQKQISRMQGRRVLRRDEDGRVELPGGIIIGDGPGEVPLVPGVPDGPTSAPTVETGAHGNRIFADLSWQEVPGAVSYVASVRADGGTFVARVETHGTSARFDWLEPNTDYIGWVVGIDALGRSTAAGPEVAFQTGQDTTIPSPVTGLTVTGGVRAIHASWDASDDHDFDWFEVAFWELGGDTETSRIKATRTFWSDLEPNRQYRVRVRAIDTSTNVGPWSSWQSAVTVDNPAAHIEEGSIETIHLANQAVDETKIKVASLVGELFADNAIDRDSILGAGTVVGDHIVSNSIQTGHVQAGAITGDLVDADTITARNMVLGSYDNLAQNPALVDGLEPHYINRTGGGTGWISSSTGRGTGRRSVQISPAANTEIAEFVLNGPPSRQSDHPAVAPGEEYVFSAWGRRNLNAPTQTATLRLIFYTASGNAISGWETATISGSNQWNFASVSGVAPDTAAWVTAWIAVPSTNTGIWYFTDFHLRERIGANLLVDGAVTARTLAAEELITDSAQIGDAVITAAKIGSVDAGTITTGTLNVDDLIDADSIDANKLQANTAVVGMLTLESGGGFIAGSSSSPANVTISSAGLEVWNAQGQRSIHFDSQTGNATFSGAITGSTIDATTITGGTLLGTIIASDGVITGPEIRGGMVRGATIVSTPVGSEVRGVRIAGQQISLGFVAQSHATDLQLASIGDQQGRIGADELFLDTLSIRAFGAGPSILRFDDRVTVGMESGSNTSTETGVSLGTTGRGIFRYSNGASMVACRINSSGPVLEFYGSSRNGSIDLTSSGGITFDTSSDYRLKTVVGEVDGALAKLQDMAPRAYTWKVLEGTDEDYIEYGFIAHEVQQVLPWAVSGTKDGLDEDGEPFYQGMDYSRTAPLIGAATLELAATVDELAAEVGRLRELVEA